MWKEDKDCNIIQSLYVVCSLYRRVILSPCLCIDVFNLLLFCQVYNPILHYYIATEILWVTLYKTNSHIMSTNVNYKIWFIQHKKFFLSQVTFFSYIFKTLLFTKWLLDRKINVILLLNNFCWLDFFSFLHYLKE